ncbi:AraC family transcriptional regulator [Shouchella shacheensis]|uniref:AraC family transcriptional regulator n=1 Tax=Shouchella shacheensis TaxID=1649580 RepID=UPI0007401572|nr:AraC family transcriptional regulator [Shouchella shacheensis]
MTHSPLQLPQLNFHYMQDWKNEEAFDFHSHEQAEIYYFHGGKCTYLIGDEILSLHPGDLILMHGLTLHRPKLFDGEPYIRSTLHFEQQYFHTILQPMGRVDLLSPFSSLKTLRLTFKGEGKAQLEGILQSIHECQKRNDAQASFRFQLLFMDLLSFLAPYCIKPLRERRVPTSEKEKNVQNVVSFIENHYMEDVRLENLQESLHLSKYHLSKIFKEVTGVTISKYLYQRRINQAKVEFMLGDVSVTDVSYKIGFKYPSHFTKVFKQLTGMTPEHYRKEVLSS